MDVQMSSKVKVAVRVRPLNRRELDLNTEIVIDMDKTQTYLKAPKLERKQPKSFTFDHCFWSMDENNPKFASQEYVYSCLGEEVVENAFKGYNACIFAYGQTGSGKSYTMMGTSAQKGLIPRICDDLFERISKIQNEDNHSTNKVEVSYMEIYNEKVRDLLCPKTDKQNLKVREHKVLGPYVDGLSKLVVNSYSDIDNLMNEGNKSRTVAATMMNAESSRSHAVFSVVLTQSQYDPHTEATGEKVSKLSLVDLAGSERVSKTGAAGDRLKEGGNINKSLTTLGLVISVLADQAAGKAKKGSFVPYRDSVLTWLLKDNLGGNSKTVMVATVSPAADNFEETLSTLRYADRAKRIENHAVVNEDPNAKIIRELREEVERLRELLTEKSIDTSSIRKSGRQSTDETGEIKEMLEESEKLMQEASLTWEQKERQTEMIHKERHRILEEMGICLQDSGIGVREGRYYLVNLNADPSLNELLVYYLKEHTKIGRHESPVQQDIQLSGLGILSEHCTIDIEDDIVYIEPSQDARTCINGQVITSRTQLRHGDRILWGNNHFFRLNCPHSANITQGTELDQTLDFDFAQNEIMLNEFDSLGEPIQNIIKQLEEHHEQEKQGALEKQRQMYEEKLEELRREKTPDVRSDTPPLIDGRNSLSTSGYGSRMSFGSVVVDEREIAYEEGIRKLREEVLKANVLVREANQLAEEMKRDTEFTVTLQIPTASLSPGRNRAPLTSEVAIVVKHKHRGTQVWSVEKLANKIFDMRDLYQQSMAEGGDPQAVDVNSGENDGLFFEVECHTLIGVATVWLECLYQDVPLDYAAPIISQQGEVCGKIAVDIRRLPDKVVETDSLCSDESFEDERETLELGSSVQVQVTISEATGLPPVLSNYVFCQYNFYDQPLTVVPPMNVTPSPVGTKTNSMLFNHSQVMTFEVSEEFIDYVSDGSLAIEVYGNRSKGFDSSSRQSWALTIDQDPDRSLSESPLIGLPKADRVRWNELIRHIELYVEIQELNEQGTFAPVELQTRDGSECGGIFQLRQGFSRRIQTQIVVPKSGQLPVVCGKIVSIAIGSVNVRAKIQKGLDSYQEHDLQRLREKWSNSLLKRREYLDHQISELLNKQDKTPGDKEREPVLIDQWVSLTEERNTVLCPAPGSGVPGAPKDWDPPPGMERQTPVIFLDLDENMLVGISNIEPESAGVKCLLPFELEDRMIDIPIMHYDQKKVVAVAPWDSSLHDSVYLNRVTQNNERIYLILKVTIRLTSPVPMMVVLRKRICVRIYKRPSIKESLKKRFLRPTNVITKSGVTFELVSHIPRQSGDETEERENLAKKAAAAIHESEELVGGDVIEKYNKGVSNVENILNLHKLRQEVLVKEKLAASGRSTKSLRKFASTPNLAHLTGAPSLTNLWRSGNFGSNTDLRRSPDQSSTQEVRVGSLEVPSDNYGARANSVGTTGVVLRQGRAQTSSKSNTNRHSFYGFDAPRLIQTAEINIDVPDDPKADPTPYLTPAGYVTSTPRNKANAAQLQPLIEDDGPSSPVRSPKDSTPKETEFPIVDATRPIARSLIDEFENHRADTDYADPLGAAKSFSETRRLSESSKGSRSGSKTSRTSEGEPETAQLATRENGSAVKHDATPSAKDSLPHENHTVPNAADSKANSVDDTMDKKPKSGHLQVGHVVDLGGGKVGTVRFCGETSFADGEWIGIELSVPEGKNDGSVKGISYFTCPPDHGLFIRADKLLGALGTRPSPQVPTSHS